VEIVGIAILGPVMLAGTPARERLYSLPVARGKVARPAGRGGP
jgi:hypothetical protein